MILWYLYIQVCIFGTGYSFCNYMIVLWLFRNRTCHSWGLFLKMLTAAERYVIIHCTCTLYIHIIHTHGLSVHVRSGAWCSRLLVWQNQFWVDERSCDYTQWNYVSVQNLSFTCSSLHVHMTIVKLLFSPLVFSLVHTQLVSSHWYTYELSKIIQAKCNSVLLLFCHKCTYNPSA